MLIFFAVAYLARKAILEKLEKHDETVDKKLNNFNHILQTLLGKSKCPMTMKVKIKISERT